MSEGELPEKAGVALMTISRLERGEHDPHVRTLWRIAKALDHPVLGLMASAGYAQGDEAGPGGG